jgi:hypothetical protein
MEEPGRVRVVESQMSHWSLSREARWQRRLWQMNSALISLAILTAVAQKRKAGASQR